MNFNELWIEWFASQFLAPNVKHFLARVHRISFLALLLVALSTMLIAADRQGPAAVNPHIARVLSSIPLLFEPNVGQDDPRVNFLSRGKGYSLHLTSNRAVFTFHHGEPGKRDDWRGVLPSPPATSTSFLSMRLVGANDRAHGRALDRALAKTFYYVGNDHSKWHANIPNYEQVEYSAVYPGIDLAYYGKQGELEYDFIVNPGASAQPIKFAVDSAWKTSISTDGELVLGSRSGEVRWRKPVAYQEIDGTRRLIAAHFVRRGERRFGFAVGDYDHKQPLIIDPVIVYSTYLGGTGGSTATGVAVDGTGNAWVVGTADKATFPTGQSSSFLGPGGGGSDAYVAEFDPNASGAASLLMTIVFGGSNSDSGNAIALDSSGNVYVTGDTSSSDFPLQNSLSCQVFSAEYCGALAGTQAAFVTEFDPFGNLLFSTYLSSGDQASGNAIAVAGSAVYVAGSEEPLLPATASAYSSSCVLANPPFHQCAFVSKMDPSTPALLYSTALGPPLNSNNFAFATAVAADASGNAYMAGEASDSFPLAGAYQAYNGFGDAFVSVIDTTQSGVSSLRYSTYLGGTNSDRATGITIDGSGRIFVVGMTYGSGFPTTPNAFQPNYPNGNTAGFVAELDPTAAGAAQLLYSTYLGGTLSDNSFHPQPTDVINAVALQNGLIYVAGQTESKDFPIKNAIDNSCGTDGNCNILHQDAFVAELDPTAGANGLIFSTFLGGEDRDFGNAIALDPQGDMFVAGVTHSTVFPTTLTGFQRALSGTGSNAFLMKINDPRADVSVTKTAGAQTASAGSTISYTITLKNSGPADADAASMTDPLPAATTFNSLVITGANAASWSCNNPAPGATGTVSCTKSVAVTNGESDTFSLVLNVDPNIANNTPITNTASVSSSATDLNTGNNSASVTVTATNLADLLLSKKANLSSVKAGSNLIYTVSVKNLGPNVAASTMMTDPIPSNSTFVSLSNGAPCTAPPVGSAGTVSCNFGGLANGGVATVQMTVKVNGSTNKTSLTNTATASTSTFDPNTANNSATVTTQIYGNKK